MSDDLNSILKYRINKVAETMDEARLLANNDSWTGVANRLYYACFYMASALMLTKTLYSKTHAGTKILFQKEFVKTGLVEQEIAGTYQLLFDLRNEGDYEDFAFLSEEDVKPFIPKAELFISALQKLIDSK